MHLFNISKNIISADNSKRSSSPPCYYFSIYYACLGDLSSIVLFCICRIPKTKSQFAPQWFRMGTKMHLGRHPECCLGTATNKKILLNSSLQLVINISHFGGELLLCLGRCHSPLYTIQYSWPAVKSHMKCFCFSNHDWFEQHKSIGRQPILNCNPGEASMHCMQLKMDLSGHLRTTW